MEQSDIDDFIASRKARLDEEKSRLGVDSRESRRSAGANPQTTRLRSESGRMRGHVSEARRHLQAEREAELSRLGSRQESPRPRQEGDRYSSMREQRLSEERRYREHAYGDAHVDPDRRALRPRRQWDENVPPHTHRVRFGASDSNQMGRPLQSQGWDEEENHLVQWARGQGRQVGRNRGRALTPPNYESPQKQTSQVNSRLRSISAPVVAEGIAAIGARYSSIDKRSRQKQYAEELRAQIREKEEMKWKEKLRNQQPIPEKTTGHSSDFADKPPRLSRLQEERLQPSYVDAGPERDYPRRQNSPIRDHRERYTPYYPPPPPGPTPSYPNYHPYYQPPWPPSAYHWPGPPYPPPMDPYYPHPLPPNPYLPPRQSEFRDMERQYKDQVEQDGGKRSTRFRDEEGSRTEGEIAGGPESTSPLSGFPGVSRGGKRLDKASYRAELEKQMKEKRQRDVMTRVEKELYDMKKSVEIYDPFGKGGCGAPMRDKQGHVVADLKQMRKRNEEKLLRAGPETPPDSPQERDIGSSSGKRHQDSSPSVSRSQEWKANEEAQRKAAVEEYRENLRRQVKEKEELKRQKKEQIKLEEQKELERLEAEQKKLKEDYQRELEQQRKKEAEIKAKNEALQRQLEEKKRLEILKKQEYELKESELATEAKNQALMERLEQAPMHRARSPPIPTLRHKLTHEVLSELPPTPARDPQPNRPLSPPVPALRSKLQQYQQTEFFPREESDGPLPQVPKSPPVPTVRNRIALGAVVSAPDKQFDAPPPKASNSSPTPALQQKVAVETKSGHPPSLASIRPPKPPGADMQGEMTLPVDVIKGLSDLRKRLQQEQSRVAKQRGATADHIFSNAVLQKPRLVGPRVRGGDNGATAPPSATVKEFVALKSSRNEFLKKFPAVPQKRTDLEMEQAALLQFQEDKLAHLRAIPGGTPQTALTNHPSRDSLLLSESTQVPIYSSREGMEPSVGLVGEGQRRRRRQWQQPPVAPSVPRPPRLSSPGAHSQFSVATIDVDSLARRNEERQQRLDAILNASSRPAGLGDHHAPQAILHNFLRQTDRDQHALVKSSSRQSEQALDCETGFHPITSELNTVM